ncbi:uncharacterized protein LOC111803561 isoform X1 [Cucurbita pepo subsp. pepo]|uniref:uncharacterized protein LOC111803561 isoform X1 n=1 Tax=Cucurbita pepo subsp. pepo TaxID=3664 RepID=UPI000C9D742C|nr:uncharacterized protein LOC111803561 isoform X1 [Cucurbita pepo subsp. pepo]
MMSLKNLHQLLEEDQEPFHLNTYIAEKRGNLKRISSKTDLQVKKRKPISTNSIFPGNFCKNACFTSFQPSPDFRKSPLFQFRSPARHSPCKSPNAIFLHIPARTAALLLEAALKIHKQKSSMKAKKTQIKNQGFARFGSVLKRLTLRNRNANRETGDCGGGAELASFGQRKSSVPRHIVQGETSSHNGRSSYGFWSETNEEGRSMDLGTSCSSQSEDSEETSVAYFGEDYCESPFRFVLQRSPSFGCRTPDFPSPAASPCHRYKEDEIVNSAESLKKIQEEQDEEDKEQCSPVSVLDAPFDYSYDEGHGDRERDGDGNGEEEEENYGLECSYASVQRTKQQLLNKLRRFEKLADLDPIELEKVMLEEELDENDHDYFNNEECEYYDGSAQLYNENEIELFVKEVADNANLCKSKWFLPRDMRKLVTDLVSEEEADRRDDETREDVIQRVCKRLEMWKEVKFNTIDMMVEEDLRKEVDEWKKNQAQRGEAATDLEVAIFSLLVEELAVELTC